MALLFKPYQPAEGKGDDPQEWITHLHAHLPNLEVRLWPDVGDRDDIEFALVWHPPPGELRRCRNLRAIFALGAGVDDVLDPDPYLPEHVPVARLTDASLSRQMTEYVTYAVLHFHRMMPEFAAMRLDRRWVTLPSVEPAERRVGIMGAGVIGGAIAQHLAGLGFDVLGWTRRPRRIDKVRGFHGSGQLFAFLERTDLLVCVLPLTPETRGIINARTLGALPRGAFLINVARGGHVVDADLLAALDSGHLAGAALDCFNEEPLPPDHPYWTHPKVLMTPHVAGEGVVRSMTAHIAENIVRSREGRPLLGLVDRDAGY